MLVALEKGSEWAKKTRDTILTMSPTSCKVTARQVKEGATRDLGECLKMEKRMACRFMVGVSWLCLSRSLSLSKMDLRPNIPLCG